MEEWRLHKENGILILCKLFFELVEKTYLYNMFLFVQFLQNMLPQDKNKFHNNEFRLVKKFVELELCLVLR